MTGQTAARLVGVRAEDLAVLPSSFERELDRPWQDTLVCSADEARESIGSILDVSEAEILSFSDKFSNILAASPVISTLAQRPERFAHEGPVYLEESREVFFTSNRLQDAATGEDTVKLYAVSLETGAVREIEPRVPVPLANGAIRYKAGRIALLAQVPSPNLDLRYEMEAAAIMMNARTPHAISNNGKGQGGVMPGGVLSLDPVTGEWAWILNNWFGLHFNSPNDIVVSPDGALWFTDPTYGCNQGFRRKPQLGEYVWRYLPGGPPARVVADGLERPNGLCFSNDGKTLYVSDTGFESGNPGQEAAGNPLKPHTIYAYDVVHRNGGDFLCNRRVFAVCDTGIPDGLKTDLDGNIYSGCGDGLNIWAASGDLIGKIIVEGGISNFVFAGNDLVMLAEERVLKLNLQCKGDCD